MPYSIKISSNKLKWKCNSKIKDKKSENMIDLIKEKKASSLNGSRYILFEFPMNNKAMIAKKMIYIKIL